MERQVQGKCRPSCNLLQTFPQESAGLPAQGCSLGLGTGFWVLTMAKREQGIAMGQESVISTTIFLCTPNLC